VFFIQVRLAKLRITLKFNFGWFKTRSYVTLRPMTVARLPRAFPCGRPQKAKKARPLSTPQKSELLERLERYQLSKKLNRSKTRNQILEVVMDQTDHFTGPELVRKVRRAHAAIGAATVYRALPVLLDAAVLRESLTDRAGQVVYEVQRSEHHDHVVCLDCKAILEFHEVGIESLQDRVLERLGFREVHHSHVVYAHCLYRKDGK
jgi:Fur family transcriptional regulator, ferric uptake regulator